ncbi:hypothetical protein [Hoeflea sp.]|uniref:hypothetical protein n=1 Tax=Hoeflea sp. TaxID=1940281 RepID=UPI00374A3ED3
MTRSDLTAAKATTLASAALAVAFTLAASASAFATDSPVFKTRHKDDVTIIVIDRKDRNTSRVVSEDKRKPSAATTFKTRDDEIRIRIPRHSRDHRDGDHRSRQTGGQGHGNDDNERRWANHNETGHEGTGHDRSGHLQSGGDRGPKVIIVDRNSSACKGSGVCVIRP